MTRFLLVFSMALAATAQTPTVVSVLNAGSFDTRLSPGVLAAIFGTNFGSGPASSVTVLVGDKKAYVGTVTANQINVQLPTDAPVGTVPLTVAVNGATSAAFSVTLDAYAPTIAVPTGTTNGTGAISTLKGALVTAAAPARPGDMLLAFALGLGATNPATPAGPAPANAPLITTPTLTVGGVRADTPFAGLTAGSVGLYQINFTVPAGVQGNQPVVLSVGGKNSSPITLPLFGITSVVSNASFGSAGTAAPGSIVSIFANGLGTTDQISGFPASTFQGVSVSFNGRSAPLFHLNAAAGSIDLVVPSELPSTGTVNVQLTTPAGPSPNYTLTMAAAVPALYRVNDPGTKGRMNILAQFANTVWLALPASTATALKLPGNCKAGGIDPLALCAEPGAPGDYLVIYTTGLGKATPNGDPNGTPLPTGMVAPADGSVLYKTVATPTVTVGGVPAMVLFSGVAPGNTGLYQVDIQIPEGVTPGDDVPVVISMPGSAKDSATVAVQPRL